MELELWKEIKEFPKYMVSNFGNVKGLEKDGTYRRLINEKMFSGYRRVTFFSEGLIRRFLVHRLVMESFNGQLSGNYKTTHMNGILHDNRPSNLEEKHPGRKAGKTLRRKVDNALIRGELCRSAVLKESDVILIKQQIKEDRLMMKTIAKDFNISPQTISRIKSGTTWRHVEC